MKRFIYTPDVQAYIATEEYGILDVSSDIISGSVTRNLDSVSNAELTLQNPYGKYLKKFKPMDRIVIYLTRIKPVLVFSGYLDRARVEQLYPGPISISASCTLKRLLHTYWDPSLPYVVNYFRQHGWEWNIANGNIISSDGSKSLWNMDLNGSIGHVLRDVLHDVGNWPIGVNKESRNTVHVLQLPKTFLTKTESLISKELKATQNQRDEVKKFLNNLLTVDGLYSQPFSPSTAGDYAFTDTLVDQYPLPPNAAGTYKATIYGPPYSASGFADALFKECQASSDSEIAAITREQCNNAGTIVQIASLKGFNVTGQAGWVAAAWPESKLRADAVNPSSLATGLFQLLSSGYYGPTGTLANIITQRENRSSNPQPGGVEAKTAAYNTLAIMTASSDVDGVNSSQTPNIEITDQYIRPSSAEKIANNYPNSNKFYPFALSALRKASATTNSQVADKNDTGQIGDVKTGFIVTNNQIGPPVPYTFRIKGNPYGDDSLIFRIVGTSPGLNTDEISIYVPGAKDKSSPQAQNWSNKQVTLETSYHKTERFKSTTPTTGTNTGAAGLYVNPLSKLVGIVPERTDQGVDYAAQSGDILAIGNCKVVGIINNWYKGTPFIWYQLLDGDQAGSYVFVAEGITNLAPIGTFLKAGDRIASYVPGASTGIEMGFATANGSVIDPYNGRPDGTATEGGKRFARFLKSLGAPVRDDPGPGAGTSSSGGGTASDGTTVPYAGATGVQLTQETVASIAGSVAVGLPLVFPLASDAAEAALFKGERALYNDVALMDFVQFMAKSSGRSFQSMPNGDFMAFYPDYFNWSNEVPYWRISDIETLDLEIDLSDDALATHVFTTADSFYPNGSIDIGDKLASTVASVESADTFREFVNVTNEFKPSEFLQRYGARPLTKEVPEIKNSFMQFMYGWMTFLEQWAKMFSASPTFTFMPELFPGSLVEFASKDLVMYVNSVTHTFDRTGGFTTSADLIAPSTRSKKYNYGMIMTQSGYTQAAKSSTPATPYKGRN